MAIVALESQRDPLPTGLRQDLPDPWIPWGISERVFATMQQGCNTDLFKKAIVLPIDPEWRFVWRAFYHDKPTNYGIKSIHCIHSRHQVGSFENKLASIENEATKFPPKWDSEPNADLRAIAIERWKQLTAPFSPFQTMESDGRRHTWEQTRVLPLWHGTRKELAQSIAETGFTFFGKVALMGAASGSTDDGYFGSGIYFTNSARYAADIYSQGHALLSWVSMREPFPVVHDGGTPKCHDMEILQGKGAYKNYNAHYIPVVPQMPTPMCPQYFPCKAGETPFCDEIVVFNSAQTLPRFWVELQVEHPNMPTPSGPPQFVIELTPQLFKLLERPDIDRDLKLRNIIGQNLGKLLIQAPDDDLDDATIAFAEQLSKLITTAGAIDKAVRQTLIGAEASGGIPLAAAAAASAPLGIAVPVANAMVSAAALDPQSAVLRQAMQLTEELPVVQAGVVAPSAAAVVASDNLSSAMGNFFGVAEWNWFFGDVGAAPSLPPDIVQFMQSPCPIFPGKRIEETHTLVLVPATVNGKPLTLDLLQELIQHPQNGGNATRYENYWNRLAAKYGQSPAPAAHWVLMTTDVLPNTHERAYAIQELELRKYSGYEVPTLLEAAAAILMGYVKTGKRWYPQSPWTYTRCQETVDGYRTAIGCFSSGGLTVSNDYHVYGADHSGLGAVQKIPGSSVSSAIASAASALLGAAVVAPVNLASAMRNFFGAADWNKYFGFDVGVEPPLPSDIIQIMKSPCPIFSSFFSKKTIEETHILVLVPATVSGTPLTLSLLGQLIQHPQNGGNATMYSGEIRATSFCGAARAPASHWILMTRDVIPNTRNKSYAEQEAELKKYNGYEVPTLLEAAAAILMGYIKTGKRWYTDSPCTFTRCQETAGDRTPETTVVGRRPTDGLNRTMVGNFSSSSLNVCCDEYLGDHERLGLGAVRKFVVADPAAPLKKSSAAPLEKPSCLIA